MNAIQYLIKCRKIIKNKIFELEINFKKRNSLKNGIESIILMMIDVYYEAAWKIIDSFEIKGCNWSIFGLLYLGFCLVFPILSAFPCCRDWKPLSCVVGVVGVARPSCLQKAQERMLAEKHEKGATQNTERKRREMKQPASHMGWKCELLSNPCNVYGILSTQST